MFVLSQITSLFFSLVEKNATFVLIIHNPFVMKKSFNKTAIAFLCLQLISFAIFAQKENFDFAYKAEAEGYFADMKMSAYGLIATDNTANSIYLIKDGKLKKIITAPGCGRYYTLSPDKTKIGFKFINQNGMQSPAIYDLNTGSYSLLHAPVSLCGQVSFSNSGTILFSIENEVHIKNATSDKKINIGTYSNIIAISPNGKYFVYNDNNDQFFLISIETGAKKKISDDKNGYVYPQWSPDGNYLLFSSLDGNLFTWNLSSEKINKIGKGGGARWLDNSYNIVYSRTTSEEFQFIGSDIFLTNALSTENIALTNTESIHEMAPCIDGSDVYFHNYNRKGILKTSLNIAQKSLSQAVNYYQHSGQLAENINFTRNVNAITKIPGIVPYVHQVYDTPEWHYGYGSCAPTTCVMAFAYYNLLPEWPITTSNGYGTHTSLYGAYVADRYRYREIYYETTATTGGGETSYGGYGFMWTGSYGPNSRQKIYIENHGLTSNQLWTYQCTYTNTITEIDLGYPHPICNYLTSSGHLTLAIGYVQNQHTLIFNDPYGNKNNSPWPNYNGIDAYYDWPGYSNGYANLDAAGTNGGVAWTTKARGTEVTYNDTIIDDVFYNHGFYMNNSTNSSHQRYFRDILGGYNGHYWYTLTESSNSDICYVTWKPNIPTAGNYEVLAYIPGGINSNAVGAKYKVHHNGGITNVVINQSQYTAQWVSLGTFNFAQGQSGYVYLGDSTGISSESIAFDAMHFKKIGQTDVTPPSTSISVPANWVTGDFSASFSDADNVGGSGLEKSYYQVLDYDGQYWGANAERGFFGDNFDVLNSSIWASPAGTGSWSAVTGNLYQGDSTINNTNIYASLNQNLSNRYIYHFTSRLESQAYGANQRRYGFHFHCDTGDVPQRGNSYFIFFRQESSQLEFYKVTNSNAVLMKVVNSITINIGQWYDVKIIHDRITGKIDVYRNDALIGTWTDPSPHTTPGNFVSFRTGHAKVSFGELKVFRSRYPTVNVTVGTANSDVRYQNSHPSIISAKIKSLATDSAGNISSIAYYDMNVDWTPPSQLLNVEDGTGNDIDTIYVTNELSANWNAATDANSGVTNYYYCIGTSAGNNDIADWTNAGTATDFTLNGLSLIYDQIYFVSVKSKNGAGLYSDITISDGVWVKQPFAVPVASFIFNEDTICEGQSVQFSNTSTDANVFFWSFPGGNPSTSQLANPSVIYTSTGNHTVQLIASGPGGADTTEQTISVQFNPLPVASFTINADTADAPFVALFTNTSQEAENFFWDFGDYSNSIDANPYHLYQNPGDYLVSLIAGNSCGNDTSFVLVHVTIGTGIFKSEMNNDLMIFPNPCNDFTKIFFNNFSKESINIELYNILGNHVKTIRMTIQRNGSQILDVSDIAKGSYNVRIYVDGKIINKRLIVL